jgi:hypothetical protein
MGAIKSKAEREGGWLEKEKRNRRLKGGAEFWISSGIVQLFIGLKTPPHYLHEGIRHVNYGCGCYLLGVPFASSGGFFWGEGFEISLCLLDRVPCSREGFQNLRVIRWSFMHRINIAFIGVRREIAWSALGYLVCLLVVFIILAASEFFSLYLACIAFRSAQCF